jgi:type III secretory pathway component EscT
MNVAVLISTPLADVYTALPVNCCCVLILLLILPVLSRRILYSLLGNSVYTLGFYFPPIVDRRK